MLYPASKKTIAVITCTFFTVGREGYILSEELSVIGRCLSIKYLRFCNVNQTNILSVLTIYIMLLYTWSMEQNQSSCNASKFHSTDSYEKLVLHLFSADATQCPSWKSLNIHQSQKNTKWRQIDVNA